MAIKIRYFARLREQIGRAEDTLTATEVTTVADCWQVATAAAPLPDDVLAAVNLEYVDLNHPVHDGDEVAFFPPVTGG